MTDSKRLQLIAEAVRYCQRVKAMGMPSACYTKVLREPIYFRNYLAGEEALSNVQGNASQSQERKILEI
ncbi:MAG: hypothetical protein DMG42_31955 [Acidobacteria bacterium]|nr:MAG: hypothetical protein DMG42_31955 [Acidobacteriota bacterium]